MADNKEIMRAYDIRGLVGTHIDNDTVFSLGLGFSKLVHAREDLHSPIIVGRDARSSSEEFAKQFISGLTLGGIDVIDIGLCTSPMTYFALHHLHAGGCVMITASHNPKEYNGIKLNNNKGLNLSPQHEAKLLYEYRSLDEEGQKSRYHDTQGKVTHENVLEPYLDFLSSKLTLHTPLRIVVDSANSVSAIPFVPLATRNQHLSVCEL